MQRNTHIQAEIHRQKRSTKRQTQSSLQTKDSKRIENTFSVELERVAREREAGTERNGKGNGERSKLRRGNHNQSNQVGWLAGWLDS